MDLIFLPPQTGDILVWVVISLALVISLARVQVAVWQADYGPYTPGFLCPSTCAFFFFFLLTPRHVEVPRPRVEPAEQLGPVPCCSNTLSLIRRFTRELPQAHGFILSPFILYWCFCFFRSLTKVFQGHVTFIRCWLTNSNRVQSNEDSQELKSSSAIFKKRGWLIQLSYC